MTTQATAIRAHRHFGPRSVLALALVSASAALAAPPLQTADILKRLGHRDYAVRQRTWCELLADRQLTAAQLDRLYVDATTAEQRHRLRDVARHHLLRQIGDDLPGAENDDAALGVALRSIDVRQFSGIRQPAAYVSRTYPGLPAFPHLMTGDIILALDGQRPTGAERGAAHIFFIERIKKAHRRGDTLRLTVRRDGRVIDDVTVTLAGRTVLAELYDRQALGPRWEQLRVAGGGLPGARAVVVPVELDAVPLRREHAERWRQRQDELDGLVVGDAASDDEE